MEGKQTLWQLASNLRFETPAEDLRKGLQELITRYCAKDPADRQQLGADLEKAKKRGGRKALSIQSPEVAEQSLLNNKTVYFLSNLLQDLCEKETHYAPHAKFAPQENEFGRRDVFFENKILSSRKLDESKPVKKVLENRIGKKTEQVFSSSHLQRLGFHHRKGDAGNHAATGGDYQHYRPQNEIKNANPDSAASSKAADISKPPGHSR